MPDRLIVKDIAVECRIGVNEREREKPQTIWISLELAIDAAKAAVGDDVEAAVDYAQLVFAVRELAQSKPYHLLETLADAIASLVLQRFGTSTVRVGVKKRALPGIDYAAVDVERTSKRARRRGRPGVPVRRRRVGAATGRSFDSPSRARSGLRPTASRRGAA